LEISSSAYIYHRDKGVNEIEEKLKLFILEIHKKYPFMGYRRIKAVLERDYSMNYSYGKIQRLLKIMGIKAIQKKKSKPTTDVTFEKSAENLLEQDFSTTKPNEKWSIDITYLPHGTSRSYMVGIKDMFDKNIISYKISKNMKMEFVRECLIEAFSKTNAEGVIIQSDQGGHFTNRTYYTILEQHGAIASTSRRGKCLDNSPIESFWKLLKNEYLYLENPRTFEELVSGIDEYVNYYNKKRYQQQLSWLAPLEYRDRNLFFFS
jgi:transposase InsO family protein